MLHTGELVFCVRFRRWPEADFFAQPSVAGKGVCHLLNVQNLTLTHQKDLVNLIENLSFTLKPGERLALIGEEGNGKSSLLRAIWGDASIGAYLQVSGRIVNPFRTGYLPQELPAEYRGMSAYDYFCESERFFE